MDCIEREKAIEIIEEKQKELCPVGKYGRGYVYGTDREEYDKWEKIIKALENLPQANITHGYWYWADDGYCRCSVCHQKSASYEHEEALEPMMTEFCPHCGAKME